MTTNLAILRLSVCALITLAILGCKSRPLGPYVSPRVTGQVLAADNHKPLAGVKVIRGPVETASRRASPPKGGELLMSKFPAQTDRNGRFELAPERVLTVFRGSSWDVVSLSFQANGYLGLHTNCPTMAATFTPAGELVLNVGEILLQPAPHESAGR